MKDKRTLTILTISPIPVWTIGKKGGAPSIFLEQEGFAKAEHKAVLVIIEGANKESKIKQKKYLYRDFLVHQVYIPKILSHISKRRYLNFISLKCYYLWYYIFAFFYGLKIAREIKPDIIIGYTNYSSLPAYLISKIRKIPYIYRENGTGTLYDDIQTFWGRVKRFDAVWAFKLPCAAMILTDDRTQSASVARHLGVSDGKIFFWRNGVFKEKITQLPTRIEARRKLKIPLTAKVIVAAGILRKTNNIDFLIKSVVKVKTQEPDILCFILGDGPEKENLQRLTQNSNLSDKVILKGAVAHEEVWEYFAACDIVAALGFVNPILEGMTAGRCVVAVDPGPEARIIKPGETGIQIKKSELAKLDVVIINILRDDERRQKIEENAQKEIINNFESCEERIKKEVQLIENIAYERSIS
jgi:L-malate glycosyltransferase